MSEPEPRDPEDEDYDLIPIEDEAAPEKEEPDGDLDLKLVPETPEPVPDAQVVHSTEQPEEQPDLDKPVEKAPPRPPPTLKPLQAFRILLWPFTGSGGPGFLGLLLIVTVALFVGWALGHIPYGIGTGLRVIVACVVAFGVLGYLRYVVLAGIGGAPEAPSLTSIAEEEGFLGDAVRGFVLILLYALPAIVAAVLAGTQFVAIPFALAAYWFFPAALLVLVQSGKLHRAHPHTAFLLARAGENRYVAVVFPGMLLILCRLILPNNVWTVMAEAACVLALAYVAYMLGLLARESDDVRDLLMGEIGEEEGEGPHTEEE